MFARGSSRVDARTRSLIRIIGEAIMDLPNPIVISGHTDSVPFSSNQGYSNWELSADRANATRRVLIDTGDVIVHIFRPDVREFYQLEKMWQPAAPAN